MGNMDQMEKNIIQKLFSGKTIFLLMIIFLILSEDSLSQSILTDINSQENVSSILVNNNQQKLNGLQVLSREFNRIGVIRIDDQLPKYKILNVSGKNNKQALKVQSATFKVIYNGFTDPAKAAFQYAVNLWASFISSTVPITIFANFLPMADANILGQGGSDDHIVNPPNAPVYNTAYALPLAEKYLGNHINHPDSADINLTFNSNFIWYYGTDGQCPNDKVDFVSVVMHEICHGLGYVPSMLALTYEGQNLGIWGRPRYSHKDQDTWFPFIYDRFVYNGQGQKIIEKYPGSVEIPLYSELQSNNLFWRGPNTGIRKLYCPVIWEQGSSVSHVDWTEPVNLMRPAIARGSVIHVPGEIVINQMKDLGWTLSSVVMNKIADFSESVSKIENYPNPFNSSTQIRLDLKEGDKISIDLYDMIGRKIKSFVINEFYESGIYNISWNGRDNNNLTVTSGMYLLRVTGEKVKISKKLTILK